MKPSLCTSVSSVSLWFVLLEIVNHRDTEDTEVHREGAVAVTLRQSEK